nr:hypothetical protein [Porphyridium aerugineum]
MCRLFLVELFNTNILIVGYIIFQKFDNAKISLLNLAYCNITFNHIPNLYYLYLIQRHYYTTSLKNNDAIQKLEVYKRELNFLITPELKKNVLEYKQDSNVIWLLNNFNNNKSFIITKGIQLFINLSTFLIAIKTAKQFILNLNKVFKSDDLLIDINQNIETKCCKYKYINKIINKIITKIKNLPFQAIKSSIIVNDKYNSCSQKCLFWIKKKHNWIEILNECGKNLENLIFKYWSIVCLKQTKSIYTWGIDQLAFKFVEKDFNSNEIEQARVFLSNEYNNYRYLLSLAKGKNDQSIKRKGLNNLTIFEKTRRFLKSKKGTIYVKYLRNLIKKMKQNPVVFVNKKNELKKEFNNKLNFLLCNFLRNNQLRSYRSKPVFRIFFSINKNKAKLKPVGIFSKASVRMYVELFSLLSIFVLMKNSYVEFAENHSIYSDSVMIRRQLWLVTISQGFVGTHVYYARLYLCSESLFTLCFTQFFDRCLQCLLKLVMEPYREPLSDENSFGFRPGRTCHQITSYTHGKLLYAKSLNSSGFNKKRIRVLKWKSKNMIYNNGIQYIFKARLKNCFHYISCKWLVKNVFMPTNYEFLLKRILQLDLKFLDVTQNKFSEYTLEKKKVLKHFNTSINNKFSLLENGILSPLLMNWALNGLQYHIKLSVYNLYTKYFLKTKLFLKQNFLMYLYDTTWFVKYTSDFLVSAKFKIVIQYVKKSISNFLNVRGLKLSEKKSEIVPWKMGYSIDFLGWTHLLHLPKKVNWLINTSQNSMYSFKNFLGVYTFPSKKATIILRQNIKWLTSKKNSYKSVITVFKNLNDLLTIWSSYFSPGPYQYYLRKHLDIYVWKRLRKFIRNKYQHSYFPIFMKFFSKESMLFSSKNKHIFYEKKSATYRQWLTSPTIKKKKYLKVLTLTSLNTSINWISLILTKYFFTKFYVYWTHNVFKKIILINEFNKDLKWKLLKKQNLTCTICNQSLINWFSFVNWSSMDIFNTLLFFNNNKGYVSKSIQSNITKIKTNHKFIQNNNFDYNVLNKKLFNFQTISLMNRNSLYLIHKVQIDYIIPMLLAGKNVQLINLLKHLNNLQLIHNQCLKNKIFMTKHLVNLYKIIEKTKFYKKSNGFSLVSYNNIISCKILIHLFENYNLVTLCYINSNFSLLNFKAKVEQIYYLAKICLKKLEKV